MAIYNIKLSNILYHWQLSMASFCFCETYLLHIRPFVVNKSAISPFLGGYKRIKSRSRCVSASCRVAETVCRVAETIWDYIVLRTRTCKRIESRSRWVSSSCRVAETVQSCWDYNSSRSVSSSRWVAETTYRVAETIIQVGQSHRVAESLRLYIESLRL